MPFGAEVLDKGVRFSLWAPEAQTVDLRLDSPEGETLHPMESSKGGWHCLVLPQARPGDRYMFRINGNILVPDPASRFQPDDVHGPSEVIDPLSFAWQDGGWMGRPWEETVFYELHVGAFTPQGTFSAVRARLDDLADLGVTAIELMPVADFPGRRNWGYDGVLPFAPDSAYGRPEDLKLLIQEAHARGITVFLDVVYNHFGPEGNYLHIYARNAFFTDRHHTPWGAAINFDGPGSRTVRDFFIENALYWLEEYHMDGLRLDAVHAIRDDSVPNILEELAQRVRKGPGRKRQIHLVLENDDNRASYLVRDRFGLPVYYTAQWNDDLHHALHCLLTGEETGYYQDYADEPVRHLARSLAEGFAYQGEPSSYRDGEPRGEPSAFLPPTAFVSFLQNHDQIGNRAFGERITLLAGPDAIRAALAVLLLAPSPPLLFMGEEYGTRRPFPFFCAFGPELASAVTEGRRREFGRFPQFHDPEARERIPDPNAAETFESAVIRWDRPDGNSSEWHRYFKGLLDLRMKAVVPGLRGISGGCASYCLFGRTAFHVRWTLGDGSILSLATNLGNGPADIPFVPAGSLLFEHPEGASKNLDAGRLPPWSVVWKMT